MAYGAIPLQGFGYRSKRNRSSIRLLRSFTDADTADSVIWAAWIFQPNTDATIAVTLDNVSVSISATAADAPVGTITVTLEDATVSAVATLPPAGSISITLDGVSVEAYATRGPWPSERHVLIGGALSGLNVNMRRKIVITDPGPSAPADALTLENGSWLLFDDGSYLEAEAA